MFEGCYLCKRVLSALQLLHPAADTMARRKYAANAGHPKVDGWSKVPSVFSANVLMLDRCEHGAGILGCGSFGEVH